MNKKQIVLEVTGDFDFTSITNLPQVGKPVALTITNAQFLEFESSISSNKVNCVVKLRCEDALISDDAEDPNP